MHGVGVATITLLLAFALLMFGAQKAEAAGPEPSTYTAVVQYYDTIQMKYIVQHGIDDYWTTTGDIPIGGFIDGSGFNLIDQAYCVDAKVVFHSSPETQTTWPSGVTTDTTPGYVVASPLAVSDNVRANLPSLYWLAVNGFNGQRGGVNNLADIRANYAALEAQYGTPIDETIAIMATKAAIWHYTDPTFAMLSTSLVPDPANPTPEQKARYELMVALMKDLVNDARIGGTTLTTTTLDVVFNNGSAKFELDGTDYYYGPIEASEQISNAGANAGTPQEVYLTASGMYASDVSFVDGDTAAASPLPVATLYGSQESAPYVVDGGAFYLKIPADSPALIGAYTPSVNFNYFALHGFGKATDVSYDGTPAIMAWQGPAAASEGEQEWTHVQAFIGFVNNMQASLYGQGHLFLRGNNDNASITVSKEVLGATDTVNAGGFVFTLEVYDNNLAQWVPVPLIPGVAPAGNITGDSGLVGSSPGGVFSLADGNTVQISNLPLGQYRVSEQSSVDGYTTVYQLSSDAEKAGFDATVPLTMQVASRGVTFTNTITPKTPRTPDTPDTPDTTVPATGDSGMRLLALAAILVAGGMTVLLRRRLQR
jgi:LPXTG-motif cell wall-anchored protein